jgi:hypothetical protein
MIRATVTSPGGGEGEPLYTYTLANGMYLLSNVVPGRVTVLALLGGFGESRQDVDLVPAGFISDLDFVLEPREPLH